jgi:hypothetical protein
MVFLAAILSFSVTEGKAGFIYHVDLDPHQAGIQNSIQVISGQSFDAHLVLEMVCDIGIDSHAVSVVFDTQGLALNSAKNTPMPEFNTYVSTLNVKDGLISSFQGEAKTIGSGPVGYLLGTIGTFRFTAIGSGGVFEIKPFEDSIFDGTFNNQLDMVSVELMSSIVTITAIPEPSMFSMMLIGMACFATTRRRCTQ